ncbi:MAG: iron ABC transporter permease [Corynebacterium casei]|uniref:FecCD family ABC transporter permease n=1 Tax=Corynebacterium casei TaxID=160386 RepID=UPI0026480153|nr:iron ABC transporter permease [Corynebacterium casei]MDN5903390.1 iron ABC transporter permease [Corynebacterium casei]MDN6627573.1 iron ABC transporter permease [Corynebacterium casei]MDN6674689.1 iron ABC transporter permease [Corynebacterium casei]MDN6694425.1 iron ABC transporter permease [Corynebacterium casei]
MNNLAVKDGHLRRITLLVLIIGVVAVMVISLMLGRYTLGLSEIYNALWYRVYGLSFGEPVDSIVFNLRLPRILLAALAGAALACSGAAFQSLFGNPLATPDTLGVTAGASVGAVLGILWNLPLIGMQLMSLLAGIATIFLTIMIAKSKRGVGIVMLILSGVIVGALANAVISILKYVADPNEKLPQITYWLMGSLAGANLRSLAIGTPFILLGIITILVLRWRLNILALGDDEARASGMNVRFVRALVIVAATLTTASVVSMCGQVGWVGLLIPHCARMLCGNNNRFVVPISLLLGAIFLVVIDTLARSVSEAEIPISVLTALVGAPFFIYLLRKTGGGW